MSLTRFELEKIEDEDVKNFMKCLKKSNKKEFELLYRVDQAQPILASVFQSSYLYRQLQLSVMSSGNRKYYLSEINLMKKAFFEGLLPKL